MLAHLHPRGLGVQHEDLARRDIGKILDLVHEQPLTAADAGDEDDVLGHPVSMDLIAAAPTQNDHVVHPGGGFAIGSCGLSFNRLHTDPVPVVIEFQ